MTTTLRRVPIGGWKRCVHEAAAFDTRPEFKAACLLDDSPEVEWWIRNEPVVVRIPTPVGGFEPDFIYRMRTLRGSEMGILEVKAEFLWDGEGSRSRVQANAACEWVRAVRSADKDQGWTFATILEQDVLDASSLDAMLRNARSRFPET
jgi:type III restriction enzyme